MILMHLQDTNKNIHRAGLDSIVADKAYDLLEDMFYSGRHLATWEVILKRKINPSNLFEDQEMFKQGFEDVLRHWQHSSKR